MKISKELLSEVLGRICSRDIEIDTNEITIQIPFSHYQRQYDNNEINKYELAHECKKWVGNKGYSFNVLYDCNYFDKLKPAIEIDFYNNRKSFSADSELEAILKACEWVLEQIKGKRDESKI